MGAIWGLCGCCVGCVWGLCTDMREEQSSSVGVKECQTVSDSERSSGGLNEELTDRLRPVSDVCFPPQAEAGRGRVWVWLRLRVGMGVCCRRRACFPETPFVGGVGQGPR